jgi:hypothetical protein
MNAQIRTLLACSMVLPFAVWMAACTDRSVFNRDGDRRPRIDRATPEATLHTYWSLIDWYHARNAPDAPGPPPPLTELMVEVATGDALASFDRYTARQDRFERTIERVEVGADGRSADVHTRIRSLSSHPQPLTPTPIELFERETGGEYRYAMVRDAGGWKVAEVWRVDGTQGAQRLR